jgi:hypothetical protein
MLRHAVTPIAAIKEGRTIQMGTGTFLRVADAFFLVSAAHVFTAATKLGFGGCLHVFDVAGTAEGKTEIRPVPLDGTLYRMDDPPDVAVYELTGDVASALTGCHFLRLTEVGPRPAPGGRCWVFGFPHETAKDLPGQDVFRFGPFFLLAPLHNTDGSLENYDPDIHFLLDAARDDLARSDGTPGHMPAFLNGISGCSVWQSEWPRSLSPDDFDPGRTRIVGVQTSCYARSSLIKATSWVAVASLLYRSRPDLQGAIELTLGPPGRNLREAAGPRSEGAPGESS